VNEDKVVEHAGGHLPFEKEVTLNVFKAKEGLVCVTLAVNNTLTPHTIPQGQLVSYNNTDRSAPTYTSSEGLKSCCLKKKEFL